MRTVLDANIFVSALISARGTPAAIVRRWLTGEFDVLISEPIIDEILRVTAYEKLQKYERLRDTRVAFVQLLTKQAVWVEPEDRLQIGAADESDTRYIECAVTGAAQYVVSGDAHLLNVAEYQGIRIVSPAAFLSLLEAGAI